MTSEVELYRHVRDSLLAEIALFGSSAERAVLLRHGDLIASLNPHAPDRSMFNRDLGAMSMWEHRVPAPEASAL